MTHSPGPWLAKTYGYEKYGIYDANGADLGTVFRHRDACFIACSTLVLECLKEARKHLDNADIDLAYIDEVIAKAEGRE